LMCDPNDLGRVYEIRSPHTGHPTIYLYERAPGGVGLAERLFRLHDELVTAAIDLVRNCGCEWACPACVGPVLDVGSPVMADGLHGLRPLGDALHLGRTAGPAGNSVAWLDTETTGLAGGTGTYVFLIGIASTGEGCVSLTQYFLRDLGAEPEMLEAVGDHLRRFDALVTFNGTRFDLPLLQTRFLLCRMRADIASEAHLDLMSVARRLWHRRLGGYSMALLEQMILKVERCIDVPGWVIPSLYVQFLHTGDFDVLEPVFAHNEQDILSLVALHGLAGELLAHPDRTPVVVDWFGLGRLLDVRGQVDAAAGCYELALEDEHEPPARPRAATGVHHH